VSGEPASYLTLEEGTDVLSADGERVGAVEHVLRDEGTGIFDGIVIDVRLAPGGLHFVDSPQVAERCG
jgi:PRC-barrel domain